MDPFKFKSNCLYTLLIASFLSCCDSFLDRSQPSDFLPSNTVLSTQEDLQRILIGAYAAFERGGIGGQNLTLLPDLMTDNVGWFSFLRPDYRDIDRGQFTPFLNAITSLWQDGYTTINQCNLVLNNLPNLAPGSITMAESDRLRGEALFLRGVCYFEMVRFYALPYGSASASAPGLPILETSTATLAEVNFPSRQSVQEVYEQAIADITEGASLLPELARRGRANRWIARAYLARIAFQQRAYEQAAGLAGAILNGPFSLVDNPRDFFTNEGSGEEIWSVVHTDQGEESSGLNFDSRNMIYTENLLNEFAAAITPKQQASLEQEGLLVDDLRLSTLTSARPDGQGLMPLKYDDIVTAADDAPILRLAEFYLMRAEALARIQGLNNESLMLLNAIRRRALRISDLQNNEAPERVDLLLFEIEDFATAEALVEAIIRERRLELAMEGNHFHDLMRLGRVVNGMPFDADLLRFPIPQREIDANANLEQNPGY